MFTEIGLGTLYDVRQSKPTDDDDCGRNSQLVQARAGSLPQVARMIRSSMSYWDAHARTYDLSMQLLGRPMPRMVALAAEAVRGRRRVLEVGSGSGLVTVALACAAREVVATDYAAAMVATTEAAVRRRGLGNVRCEQADLYALPFADGAFDAVVAANVLHLVPDLPAAIAALSRVVAPGGLLVLPTFCHAETMVSRAVSRVLGLTGFPGARRFSARSLRQEVASNGIVVTREELVPGLLPIGYVEGTRSEPASSLGGAPSHST